MRQALTISLPENLKLEMDEFIEDDGNTRSDFVRIAIAQSPIYSQAKAQGLGYMSATSANGNLP